MVARLLDRVPAAMALRPAAPQPDGDAPRLAREHVRDVGLGVADAEVDLLFGAPVADVCIGQTQHVEGGQTREEGHLARGVHRYSRLYDNLRGASKKMLTDSLRSLERACPARIATWSRGSKALV